MYNSNTTESQIQKLFKLLEAMGLVLRYSTELNEMNANIIITQE